MARSVQIGSVVAKVSNGSPPSMRVSFHPQEDYTLLVTRDMQKIEEHHVEAFLSHAPKRIKPLLQHRWIFATHLSVGFTQPLIREQHLRQRVDGGQILAYRFFRREFVTFYAFLPASLTRKQSRALHWSNPESGAHTQWLLDEWKLSEEAPQNWLREMLVHVHIFGKCARLKSESSVAQHHGDDQHIQEQCLVCVLTNSNGRRIAHCTPHIPWGDLHVMMGDYVPVSDENDDDDDNDDHEGDLDTNPKSSSLETHSSDCNVSCPPTLTTTTTTTTTTTDEHTLSVEPIKEPCSESAQQQQQQQQQAEEKGLKEKSKLYEHVPRICVVCTQCSEVFNRVRSCRKQKRCTHNHACISTWSDVALSLGFGPNSKRPIIRFKACKRFKRHT